MKKDAVKFSASGHENVLGTHGTTIEFNHDDYLTPQGDCIVGIRSDYDVDDFLRIADKLRKIKVTISCNKVSDSVVCYYNPEFSDPTHMIIRTSDWTDERTFAVRANKCANDLDRKLIEQMKSPDAKINVLVEPVRIKAVVFDFDNTLEEWTESSKAVLDNIARWLHDEFNVREDEFKKVFLESNHFFGKITDKTFRYSRKHWFKRTFDAMCIYADPEIYEKLYWEEVKNTVQLLPGVPEVLDEIKLKKGIITDSDGKPKYKLERIKQLGIMDKFDDITLGDDVGKVKPNEEIFLLSAKRLGVKPEECIYVGDRPEADFPCSKRLGITTVFSFQNVERVEYKYIDFYVPKIIDVLGVLKELAAMR
jgi:hypothetical protein